MSLLKDIAEQPDAPKKEVYADTNNPGLNLPMIREFNVQKALKTSDGSDAGKTDVVDRAAAASDIGFNLMRNTINSSGAVTGSDVADYIERAEELNDEVDTVPFGLETDDGKIVKVYVNAEQADKFEEAMKNMLGLEDDIEEAINRLTSDFDIVDVVWPKSDDEDGDGVPDPDQDLEIDDTSNLELDSDPEDDEDFADDQYDVIAGGDTETPPEVDAGSGKAKTAADDDAAPEEEPVEEPASDDESEEEEPAADDEGGDDEPDPDKPKKKRKRKNGNPAPAEPAAAAEGMIPDGPVLNEQNNKQEIDMTLGTRFLERVLNEADGEDNDGVKDGFNIPLDSQARAMAAKQKLPWAKRLVAFHFMCGVPGRYMNTADVSEAIAGAADMLRKKVAVRRAFSTLYEGLSAAKGYNLPQTEVTEATKPADTESLTQNWKKMGGGVELKDAVLKHINSKNNTPGAQEQALDILQKLKFYSTLGAVQRHIDAENKKKVSEAKQIGNTKSDAKSLAGQNVEKQMKAKDALKKAKAELAKHLKTYDGGTGAREKALRAEVEKAQAKVKKLSEEIEQLDEAKAKRGSFIQKLLESVLIQLGLPEALVVTTGPAVVGTGIYNTAELIEQDSKLERALRLLATRMGIKGQDAMEPVAEEKKAVVEKDERFGKLSAMANKLDEAKIDDDMIELLDRKAKGEDEVEYQGKTYRRSAPKNATSSPGKWKEVKSVKEAVDVGNDDYAQAVTGLVAALGIPDDILNRRRTQVVQALREKRGALRNRAQVLTMIGRLMEILQKNTVERGGNDTGADDAAGGDR